MEQSSWQPANWPGPGYEYSWESRLQRLNVHNEPAKFALASSPPVFFGPLSMLNLHFSQAKDASKCKQILKDSLGLNTWRLLKKRKKEKQAILYACLNTDGCFYRSCLENSNFSQWMHILIGTAADHTMQLLSLNYIHVSDNCASIKWGRMIKVSVQQVCSQKKKQKNNWCSPIVVRWAWLENSWKQPEKCWCCFHT